MSYGFHRMGRANRIRNLVVDSVDAVDKAANEESRIFIRKRYTEGRAEMTNSAQVIKARNQIASGEMDTSVAARLVQYLAEQRYPGDKHALSKFLADADGAALNTAASRAYYRKSQIDGAHGGDEAVKRFLKHDDLGRADGSTGGQERDDNSESRTMTTDTLNDDLDDAPGSDLVDDNVRDRRSSRSRGRKPKRTASTFADRGVQFAEKVSALQKRFGLTFDQAATEIIRADRGW